MIERRRDREGVKNIGGERERWIEKVKSMERVTSRERMKSRERGRNEKEMGWDGREREMETEGD